MQPTMVTPGMRYWRIAPDPRLRGWVQCYWVVEGLPFDASWRSKEPSEDLLIPDGLSEIVFNRGGGAFDRWKLGEPERKTRMSGSYVIGGRSHSVNTSAVAPLQLAGVKLDSRFLRGIIKTPLSEFRDSTLSLTDLGDKQLLALEGALGSARCLETVVGLLDNFFCAAMRDLRPNCTVDALVARIHEDRGATPIMEWARRACVNSRTLERTFCANVGMTPKQYSRVIRFRRRYHALISDDRAREALGANIDGFFDQSHFNREFRHFTGVAPTTKLSGRMSQGMLVSDHLLQVED